MILSSCHDYSLNNDCHCCCHCHYMQRIYVYFIMSSLALPCLVLSWVEWTNITIVIIGMTLYELVLHYITKSYHIISYLMFFCFISSADLITIRFDYILFYWIRFTILFSIVSQVKGWGRAREWRFSRVLFRSLALPCLALPWCEWTSITIVIIGMTLYELVLHYHIISYHIISHVFLFYLFCWFDLHSILFYSILLYFKLIRFDLILFNSIEFDLLYCSV